MKKSKLGQKQTLDTDLKILDTATSFIHNYEIIIIHCYCYYFLSLFLSRF